MKKRLLRKLRREASEHFKYKIISNSLDTYAFVESDGILITSFLNGYNNKSPRERAIIYCKENIRSYILGRVERIKTTKYI